ncbi:MAG: hypothetical protein J6Q53_05325 [Oscillospiraceae bacterium]|nr:hypothetical protein [Oscillospiraceae bacterium]
MDRRKFIIFLTVVLCMLTGCRKKELSESVSRIVTQVSVISTNEGQLYEKIYTAPEKMKVMLNYLRLLDPYTTTDITPDTFRTDAYEITVSYSDGTNTIYRQIYNQYLQEGDGAWKRIDPVHGSALLPIVSSMPSDRA